MDCQGTQECQKSGLGQTYREEVLHFKVPIANQSHYKEVPGREIFMEQKLRFGMNLGQLVLLKKKNIWADYGQVLRPVFSSFRGQKK